MTTTPAPSPLTRLARAVAKEKVGGLLLIAAALVGLVLANSPLREAFHALADTRIGPAALHLDLTVATWAADGLLAIFFFVVGLELKHELVAGSLRSPARAAVPVIAAVGGMAIPALIYIGVASFADQAALTGWAIPAATDIAFALAVLAVFGSGLPVALRTFLLTLAVVDDLLAIIVIAAFYSSGLSWLPLLGSVALVAVFAWLARAPRLRWWLMVPVALVAWALMHESGVHATIAGVLLGLVVPARQVHGEDDTRTHSIEHRVRPLSAGIALPVFALFSAGVTVIDGDGIGALLAQPVLLGVAAALVLGKLIGVLGTTALVTKLTRLRLADGLGLRDLVPIAFLTGIGFTVSLLIAELSFPGDPIHTDAAKIGVLLGTLVAAIIASVTLAWDSRQARGADMNEDGLPDGVVELIGPDGSDWTEHRSDDEPLATSAPQETDDRQDAP